MIYHLSYGSQLSKNAYSLRLLTLIRGTVLHNSDPIFRIENIAYSSGSVNSHSKAIFNTVKSQIQTVVSNNYSENQNMFLFKGGYYYNFSELP